MATKIQFKYGQYEHDAGCQLSIDNPGLVVFNGRLQEIYVDGKTFGSSDASIQALIQRILALETFRTNIQVDTYQQAKITVNSVVGSSDLLIANIGQSYKANPDDKNDGKIYTNGNFTVKLAGIYNETTNKIATEDTVKKAVEDLKVKILGTIDPSELEKTLDTIKEIQDVLINGSYTIDHITGIDPVSGEPIIETVRAEKIETREGGVVTLIKYTNGGTEGDEVIYATQIPGESIVYEENYLNLKSFAPIDNLVANVNVNENTNHGFVTANRTDANVTIGVGYGVFKTGRQDGEDWDGIEYTDGLATVEDVQNFIEERLSWFSYDVDND